MVVVIDNYDSFVFNLARYFRRLGQPTLVFRNDEISIPSLVALNPDAVVISPGPCDPNHSGISLQVANHLGPQIPVLGICLGMQAIVQAFGGSIVHSNPPVHGQSSLIDFHPHPLFDGLPNPFVAGRYHSLVAEPASMPACLHAIAFSEGHVMAVAHRQLPVAGFQFHPESILTPNGELMLSNFLGWAGKRRATANEIGRSIAKVGSPIEIT
jgi:anthranilate synthase component II